MKIWLTEIILRQQSTPTMAGDIVQLVECLPTEPKTLGLIPQNHIKLARQHKYHPNSSTGKDEAGGSEIQGHLQIYSQFEASLGYTRSCLKQQNPRKTC